MVLGLARQGKALARYLARLGARVVVSDLRPAAALSSVRSELEGLNLEYVFGEHPLSLLKGAYALFVSGGVPLDLPLVQAALAMEIRVANDAQLFLESCPAPALGITGSAGKTTTTALLGNIAQAAFAGTERRVWVGGNIGNPLIDDLEAIREQDLVVIELSSFQLELMDISPQVAVVLNITPNHLDRHRTMEAYTAAKRRILEYQSREVGIAVLNRDDPGSWDLRHVLRGRLISFGLGALQQGDGIYVHGNRVRLLMDGSDRALFPIEAVRLRGEHNLLNVLAACSAAAAVGLPDDAIGAGVRSFEGVPHRLEIVRRKAGVTWINDSIATAPERAMAAIRAFDEPLVLLAGGRDKDLPWEAFAKLVRQRVDHLVLFGEAGAMIEAHVRAAGSGARPYSIERFDHLQAAVEAADRVAQAGDVVLLSPGGTSFDAFVDFAERGERFREWVQAL